MTSPILTPWWRDRVSDDGTTRVAGSTSPTRILDWTNSKATALASETGAGVATGDDGDRLRSAHPLIAGRIRPVYSVNDTLPVSRVLARGRGSCSQR